MIYKVCVICVFGDLNRLARAEGVDEGLGKFLAGGIAVGVEDACDGVPAFEAKGEVVGVALFQIGRAHV